MKTFFEKINAWFLTLFLIGCGIFIFLLASVSEIVTITLSFFLFLFFFIWLIYQPKKEKVKFLKIFSILFFLSLSTLIIYAIINKKIENKKEMERAARYHSVEELLKELPKETVKIRTIKYHKWKGKYYNPFNENPYYFGVEVENISEKYRVEDLTVRLTVYKDNTAFYKCLSRLNPFSLWGPALKKRLALNPKGITTIKCYIEDIRPDTFPPEPWMFSAEVESVKGKLF